MNLRSTTKAQANIVFDDDLWILENDPSLFPQVNNCICRWRVYKMLNPNPEKLDIKKRSFMIDSYGVLVKLTINKNAKGERVMREFAKLSQNYDKTDRDKYKLKRIELLSEAVDYTYVNKMGNL
jgi:hypothetical protein